MTMVKMTQSFRVWCLKYHSDIYPLLMFGHLEEFTKTKELLREYLDWCKTDEGRQYLKGGSKYKEDKHMNDLISRKSALALVVYASLGCFLLTHGSMKIMLIRRSERRKKGL